jgi:hypothetical protein
MSDTYTLGEVNVDSLKEALLFLSTVYPFVDETAKEAFTKQVNGLDSAGNPTEGIVDQIHPTDIPEAPAETETAAEETTETTEKTPAANATETPDGAAVANTATANESNAPAEEISADEHIAALEAQLADAKAAASQTPVEGS